MSEQQNVDVVRRAYEAFGRGDIEALLNLLDDNIEWSAPGPADLPTAGRRRGRQQVAEFFKALNENFEFDRFEPTTFIAQGEHVVVLGEETYRIRRTGTAITAQWAHAAVVRHGRIVTFTDYADVSATVDALRAAAVQA
jgi:ketosteroid isomerase-like protein